MIDILARLLKNIAVFVDFQENAISYTTIGTDSISSCTFVLVTDNFRDRSFAYLSHYPESFEPPRHTATSTLVYSIDQISANVKDLVTPKDSSSEEQEFKINELNNLQILVGGGVEEERDLIREAFTLLNNFNCDVGNLLENQSSKYLYQQLKCKATRTVKTFIYLLLFICSYRMIHVSLGLVLKSLEIYI